MKSIIQYLKSTYDPEAIILYGSYADGSNNENSDFDALVITGRDTCSHDGTTIDGILLDVFLYTPEALSGALNCEDFLQLHDGKIILDKNGQAAALLQKIHAYIQGLPLKDPAEIKDNIAWCEKMLLRTTRQDAEGYYRWHWLLTESLEIYCDLRQTHYWGPKKALHCMEAEDPAAFQLYADALKQLDPTCLANWITFLKSQA